MRKFLIILLLFVTATINVQAQYGLSDSLRQVYASAKTDTQRVHLLLRFAFLYDKKNKYHLADSLAKQALALSQKKQFPKLEVLSGLKLGKFSQDQGNYKKALLYYNNALQKNNANLKDLLLQAKVYNALGSLLAEQGEIDTSEEYYHKALRIYENTQNLKGITASYMSLGRMLKGQKKYKKALVYYDKALPFYQKLNEQMPVALIYKRKGVIYRMLKNYRKSEEFYLKALNIYKKKGAERGIASTLYNLGLMYAYQKNYPKAIEFSLKSLKIKQKVGTKRQVANSFSNLGELYILAGKLNRADTMLKRALEITKKQGMNDLVMYNYYNLALLDSARGNMAQAWEYIRQHEKVKDKIYNKRKQKTLISMRTKYEAEKKEHENELLKKEKAMQAQELKAQYLWLVLISGGFLTMLMLALVLYHYYRSKQKANTKLSRLNQELHMQQEEIMSQHDLIENQNKVLLGKNTLITQSIRAAKSIQEATLPFPSRIKAFLEEYFALYLPKDIVSGDFYWIEKIDNKIFVIAVDCTGHGVPGAFMSMITNTLLDHIIKVQGTDKPREILSELHVKFGYALKKEESKTNSGMDVGVCVLEPVEDQNSTQIVFAGARRPLYYVVPTQEQLTEIRGSRRSIGTRGRLHVKFEEHTLLLPKGSIIYLSSDGYADQNDFQRRKLGTIYLKKLLFEISAQPVAQQKEVLLEKLKEHAKDTEQRDDILLLGIRL